MSIIKNVLFTILAVALSALIFGWITHQAFNPIGGYYTARGFVETTAGIDYPTLLEWLNPFADLSKYE